MLLFFMIRYDFKSLPFKRHKSNKLISFINYKVNLSDNPAFAIDFSLDKTDVPGLDVIFRVEPDNSLGFDPISNSIDLKIFNPLEPTTHFKFLLFADNFYRIIHNNFCVGRDELNFLFWQIAKMNLKC